MVTRRVALVGLGALAGATALAPRANGAGQAGSRTKVIDAHNHLNHHSRGSWREDDRKLIDDADKLGIDQLCCSIVPLERPITLAGTRDSNRWMKEAMERFPGRILGYCFINPGYKESLDEVRRCVEGQGFIGVKLYNDYKITEPVLEPLLELSAKLKFPILQHAGHTTWLPQPQPRISDAGDVAEAVRRFPEATIICAHICGGGDWEWSIKALRDAPANAYFDTSGSVIDEGTVEFAVRTLGAGRVLFASDLSLTASMGRIRGARISEDDRRRLMGGNMSAILARRSA
jgi:uncharacterized protein